MVRPIRVLIVDDSAFSRQTIKGMLENESGVEVIGIAVNGIDAMAKAIKLNPDVITLDFEMPEMDGFSFLRWLMKTKPIPVIMVTSHGDSKTVFKALELGAVDFVVKPSRRATMELQNIQEDLLTKIRGVGTLEIEKLNISRTLIEETAAPPVEAPEKAGITSGPAQEVSSPDDVGIVAIGSSTGGPTALQVVLTRLPATFPGVILISQHMPKGFTGPFAERLDKLSRIKVKEAAEGDSIERGKVLICPGGFHMAIRKKNQKLSVTLKEAKGSDKYTPSIDMMMSSAAEHFGSAVMGVILTGMGNDGRLGVMEIKEKGGYTIAEAESTAVIFGMPQEAIRSGYIDRVLPLQKIPEEITAQFMGKDTGDGTGFKKVR